MPLIINKTEVNNISGPVSMYILCPNEHYLSKYPYAPIFILFGDKHKSGENMCEDKDGNLRIYDINFLKLLNSVTTKKEPIYFFLEGGDLHLSEEKERNPKEEPMIQLWNLYAECYSKRALALYPYDKTKCDEIKNVMWQSGDLRFFVREKNKYLDKCKITQFLDTLIMTPLPVVDGFSLEQRFNVRVRGSLQYFEQKGLFNCWSALKNETFSKEEIYKQFVEERTGLIRKQLLRLRSSQHSEINDFYKEYINYVIDKFIDEQNDLETLRDVHNNATSLFQYSLSEKYINEKISKLYQYYKDGTLHRYKMYMMLKYTLLLDLYTLSRSFKVLNKSKDVNPMINICYFGELHIEHITYFLTKILKGYDIIFEKKNKESMRCVNIETNVDLDYHINLLNTYRK